MDRNDVRPIPVSINTKFLNCLQLEWSKFVTMIRQNQTVTEVAHDQLYDSLLQFEPHVQASKAKRAARTHDLLALIAHSNAYSSQSHTSPSYSHSPQPYYVIHPSSVVDYEEDYQRGVTRGFSRRQAYNRNDIVQRVPRTKSNPGKANFHCYNCNEKGHYARDCQKPRVHDAKYFREQMLLAMKDEAGSNLKDEENDFMLNNSYGDETLKELTAVSEVNVTHKMISKGVHEHKNHGKRKTVINTSNDDQIDSNIIFDDLYVESNGGTSELDLNDQDPYCDIKILA
ncbi:retrovirus-related pol polyprotein from transposon TNT 1-94 [Tanacetum coccineum]